MAQEAPAAKVWPDPVAAREWGRDEIKSPGDGGGDNGQDWETVKFRVPGSTTRDRDM